MISWLSHKEVESQHWTLTTHGDIYRNLCGDKSFFHRKQDHLHPLWWPEQDFTPNHRVFWLWAVTREEYKIQPEQTHHRETYCADIYSGEPANSTGRLTVTFTVRLLDLSVSSQTDSLTSNNCSAVYWETRSYHLIIMDIFYSTNKQRVEIKSAENKVKLDLNTEQVTEMLFLSVVSESLMSLCWCLFSGLNRPDSHRTEQKRWFYCGCND